LEAYLQAAKHQRPTFQTFDQAVDPTEAERFIDRILIGDGWATRV
jgi:hypothetical protein